MSGSHVPESNGKCQKADSISAFMFELHEAAEPVMEFDSRLWLPVIDSLLVKQTGALVFRFRNGMEVER